MSLRRVCALLDVPETDTIVIQWDNRPQPLRLMDVLPEAATSASSQPPTRQGHETLTWLRDELLRGVREVQIEFPGTEPSLSNTGKLLGYARVGDELLNVRMVRTGRSPCFCKYGHPRCHREAMEGAEIWARREGLGIWGDAAARSRYEAVKNGWLLRAGQVEGYRRACDMGEDILDARLDYDDIVTRARAGMTASIFADFAHAFRLSDGSVLFQLGSPYQPLCALFPVEMRPWALFVERDRVGRGKANYLYLSGPLSYASDQPQMVINTPDQMSTWPPRHEI